MTEWRVANGVVVAMTMEEKAAMAAAEAAALLAGQRSEGVSILNTAEGIGKLQRCIADIMKDEINIVRQWTVSFKIEVAAASTLADLKTRVATLPTLNDRTLAQLKTLIINKLNAGTND